MKGQVVFEINKYACMVDYELQPRAEPIILSIEFMPDLLADDVQYQCDIIVPEGSTIGSKNVIMRYLEHCYIGGGNLYTMIEREI